MARCTSLCDRIYGLQTNNGKLPSHDGLVAHLSCGGEDPQNGWSLGKLHDIQQRTHCPFCQLVAVAISDTTRDVDPDQHIRVVIFPGEQSLRLSFPSRLGTHLAFIAGDESQIGGVDNARLIESTAINMAKIEQWLKMCEDRHHGCVLRIPQLPRVRVSLPLRDLHV
jgi:hypothetical protein